MKRDLFWVKTTKQSKAGGQDEIAKGKVTIIILVIRSSTVRNIQKIFVLSTLAFRVLTATIREPKPLGMKITRYA